MGNDIERDGVGGNAIQQQNIVDQERREAMLRLAKYTAPAMLAVLLSDKAMAAVSGPV